MELFFYKNKLQDVNKKIDIDLAYKEAMLFSKSHYENFPVASFLIPKDLRKHISIIYWFARIADDLADEGQFTEAERTQSLDLFEERLKNTLNVHFQDELDAALYNTIHSKKLSPKLFFDLISAFRQDITKKRYADFNELLNYCSRSANPVGRLILELYDIRENKAFEYSDNICTALQLTNFYQDISIDIKKGRIYIPQDELIKFKVSEKLIENNEINEYFKELIQFNIDRTLTLFENGRNLLQFLSGRLKFEISWTILGGMEILNKIKKSDYDLFKNRPVLSKLNMIRLLVKTIGYGAK